MPDDSLQHIATQIPNFFNEELFWLIASVVLLLGILIGWAVTAIRKQKIINDLESSLDEERAMNQERHATMRESFIALSAEALQKNNAAFLQLAQQNLSRFQTQAQGDLALKEQAVADLVKPIREALDKTEKQLKELERDRRETHGALTQHLENMAKTQAALHSETRNLVQALRRPEVRGQWGELTLRRLAELSGMVEHCDFVEQVHVRGEDGALRPDMIVHMPGGREIVVDVKTPLDSYLSAVESSDPSEQQALLKQHAKLVRERVRTLAGKRYWDQFERAPDFVILFIPGDQFLAAALDHDHALLEDAMAQKVVLATPSSLVALLRAVAYGWKQESLNRNAEQIRTVGEELHNRIATVSEHLTALGRNLGSSVVQFNRLVGSFQSKLLPGARKFTELGINVKKSISEPEQIETAPRETENPD